MSVAASRTLERRPSPPAGLPRLLAGLRPNAPLSLEEHIVRHGPLPATRRGDLIAAVEASGLRGRGGAGFPTGQKLRAVVTGRGRPVVVVNATEGEPVSGKDKVLLRHAPHLVLDGAAAAAAALGARQTLIAVAAGAAAEQAALSQAIAARKRHGVDGRTSLTLVAVPDGFVTGEETALVDFLNGGSGKPTFKPPRPFERGVGGAPTLVHNAETLAHMALIARFGPAWFRQIGTPAEPGSALLTVSGAVRRPGVHEVALGSPLVDARRPGRRPDRDTSRLPRRRLLRNLDRPRPGSPPRPLRSRAEESRRIARGRGDRGAACLGVRARRDRTHRELPRRRERRPVRPLRPRPGRDRRRARAACASRA